MNILKNIFDQPIIEALGQTIIHSLWQGAVLALCLAFVLFLMRRQSSKHRYYVACVGMLVFLMISTITFFTIYDPSAQPIDVLSNYAGGDIIIVDNTAVEASEQPMFLTFFAEFTYYFQEHFPIIVTAWLMGILLFTLRLVSGYTYVLRLKSYKTKPVNKEWEARFEGIVEKLGITQKVKLLESSLAKVPMAVGYLKPVVLMPVGTLTGMPVSQVEAIIAHELAHIQRKDYLINIFQSVIEILFFYHPAMWWIGACIREERENACDDIAVEICGNKIVFAKALTSLEERAALHTPRLAMAFGRKRGSLLGRVRRLVGRPEKQMTFSESVVILSLITLSIFSFAFTSEPITDDADQPVVEEISVDENSFLADQLTVFEDSTKKKKKNKKVKKGNKKGKVDKKGEKIKIKGDDDTKVIIIDGNRKKSGKVYYVAPDLLSEPIEYVIPEIEIPEIKVITPEVYDFPVFKYGKNKIIIDGVAPMVSIFDSNDSSYAFNYNYDLSDLDGFRYEIKKSPNVLWNSDDLDIEIQEDFPIVISAKKKGKSVVIAPNYSPYPLFFGLDSPDVDNKEMAVADSAYRAAIDKYREAARKHREEWSAQREKASKAYKEAMNKYHEERKKHLESYREEIAKQRAELSELRAKEREALQKQLESFEEAREEAMVLREKAMEEKMKALEAEVRKREEETKKFLKKFRNELLKDGFIKDENEKISLQLDENSGKVNGVKMTDAQVKKYQGMLRDKIGTGNFTWKSDGDIFKINFKH